MYICARKGKQKRFSAIKPKFRVEIEESKPVQDLCKNSTVTLTEHWGYYSSSPGFATIHILTSNVSTRRHRQQHHLHHHYAAPTGGRSPTPFDRARRSTYKINTHLNSFCVKFKSDHKNSLTQGQFPHRWLCLHAHRGMFTLNESLNRHMWLARFASLSCF